MPGQEPSQAEMIMGELKTFAFSQGFPLLEFNFRELLAVLIPVDDRAVDNAIFEWQLLPDLAIWEVDNPLANDFPFFVGQFDLFTFAVLEIDNP